MRVKDQEKGLEWVGAERLLNTWVLNQGILGKNNIFFVVQKIQLQNRSQWRFSKQSDQQGTSRRTCLNDSSSSAEVSCGAMVNIRLLW